jgi:endonuclease/exonuclease/phosphatase (EEP) superfamily protein YafD
VLALRRERLAGVMRARDHIVKLVALAAIAASVMPLGAKVWWGFELASHFRVQYVVLDVVLLVVLAWQRQWLWSGTLAACAAWSFAWVAPYVPFGPGAAAATGPAALSATIELMAANLLYLRAPRRELLELVLEESPDVLVLVEYTPEWSAITEELRGAYPHRIEAPADDAYGIALFSRFPLESGEPIANGGTTAIEARVRTPAGPLTLLGVHLRSPHTPAKGAERNRQLELLAERLAAAKRPVAVIGDFNVTPYSPFYVELLERSGLTDTRRGRTSSSSWPAYLPLLGIPIDHCLVSRDVTIVAHRRLPRFGSDHYPILAELALPAPPAGITNATGSP